MNTLLLSHSSLTTFRTTCARKFQLQKILNFPRGDYSYAGSVGNAMHNGFEHYMIHGDKDAALIPFLTNFPIELYREQDRTRNLEACYATLNALFRNRVCDELQVGELQTFDNKIYSTVEVPFHLVIEGFDMPGYDQIIYRGFMDLIVYDSYTGNFVVADLKTHRRNIFDMTAAYMNDEQCLSYALILQNILGEKLSGFDVKYISAYIDLIKPTIKTYTFHKTEEDVAKWINGLAMDLSLIKMYLEMKWFRQEGGSCMQFNAPCQFLELCGQDDDYINMEFGLLDDVKPFEFEPWVTVPLRIA